MSNASSWQIIGVVMAIVLLSLLGGIVTGWWVWTNAPVVGGNAWPYIRITVTAVGVVAGAKATAWGSYLIGMGAVGVADYLIERNERRRN